MGNLLFAFLQVTDAEFDQADVVALAFAVDGAPLHPAPLAMLEDRRPLSSSREGEGERATLVLDVCALDTEDVHPDLRRLSRPGFVGSLEVKLWVRDFDSEEPSETEDLAGAFRFDNNDPPELTIVSPTSLEELHSGVVPIRYTLLDREGTRAKLDVKVDLGDGQGLRPAHEFPLGSDGLVDLRTGEEGRSPCDDKDQKTVAAEAPVPHVFLWDALSQARGNEHVTLTVSASDAETTSKSVALALSFSSLAKVREVPAGRTPEALVSGDCNRDGFQDVVVASPGSGEVTYLRGGPEGLTWYQSLGDAREPVALATGFFDDVDSGSESYLDVAVADRNSGSVIFLKGSSDGFSSMGPAIPAGGPKALTSGDYDGDGFDDVVVAHQGGVTLIPGGPAGPGQPETVALKSAPVALANGSFDADRFLDVVVAGRDGRLTCLRGGPEGLSPLGPDIETELRPTALTTGDYDGDGLDGVVVADFDANLVVYLQGGAGCLRRVQDIEAGSGPTALANGDYDGDGFLDVAVANRVSSDVTYLRGGRRGLSPAGDNIPVGTSPAAVESGDWNGDGFLDVVVANSSADSVTYLQGGWEGLREGQEIAVGEAPEALAAADYDGDGIDDVAVANRQSDDVTFLRGWRGGLSRVREDLVVGGGPTALVSADFDQDGFSDAVVANRSTNTVTYLQRHSEGLRPQPGIPAGNEPTALAVGDFDGDGFPDLAIANQDLKVRCLRGSSTGLRFATEVALQFGGQSAGVRTVTSGDYSGDGLCDVAVGNDSGSKVTYLRGSREALVESVCEIQAGTFATTPDLTGGDYDGDGAPEIVAARAGMDSEGVTYIRFPGQAAGPCPEGVDITTGDRPSALANGDYDGDGFLDVAVANRISHDVTYLRGGDGGLVRGGQNIALGSDRFPVALGSGDYDGDGFCDLAVVNSGSDNVHHLRGGPEGLGPAEEGREIALCRSSEAVESCDPSAIATADLNADGFADAVVACVKSVAGKKYGILTYLEGGPAGLVWAGEFEVGDEPSVLATGDYGGDGFTDVLVANSGSNTVTYLRQRYLLPHASRIVGSPGYHLEAPVGSLALPAPPAGMAPADDVVGRVSLARGVVLLDPRMPPRYRLVLPPGAFASPTQVCVVPGPVVELPQGEAFQRDPPAFLTAVTEPVTVLEESRQISRPAELTLRLLDHDEELFALAQNPLCLRVLRKREASAMSVITDCIPDPDIVDFGAGKGVRFSLSRFGTYVMALERER